MGTRNRKHVVALTCGLVLAAISGLIAATPTSTIYSFGTLSNDGKDPKGSLTYVDSNGLVFGRTTETVGGNSPSGTASYGVIFQLDPSNHNPGSTYQIDHWFTGSTDPDAPDGADPRHDAMTLFNGRLDRNHVGRRNK